MDPICKIHQVIFFVTLDGDFRLTEGKTPVLRCWFHRSGLFTFVYDGWNSKLKIQYSMRFMTYLAKGTGTEAK